LSPRKNPDALRFGGPGASHENRQKPRKSKPHGDVAREDARSGSRREHNKPWGKAESFSVENNRSRADAGATKVPQKAVPARGRGVNPHGDTAADTDLIKPRSRRQVR
jgi:hypothetical protein